MLSNTYCTNDRCDKNMIISPETTYQPTNMFINNCEMPESLIKCNNMIYNQNIQPKKYNNKV